MARKDNKRTTKKRVEVRGGKKKKNGKDSLKDLSTPLDVRLVQRTSNPNDINQDSKVLPLN